MINGGPGGYYDQVVPGSVITNIIEYNSLIKLHCGETANEILEDMKKRLHKNKEQAEEEMLAVPVRKQNSNRGIPS